MVNFSAPDLGKVEMSHVDGAPQIRLCGECDLCVAPRVQKQLEALISQGERKIIFDLERVTFLDSSVLRVFLNARQLTTTHGGQVVLLCRPGFVRRLLRLLEIDRLVQVCTPEEWRRQVAAVH